MAPMLSEEIKFEITLRPDETPEEAAERNAVDAVYAARDAGGTMHDAGAWAARAALEAFRAQGEGDG